MLLLASLALQCCVGVRWNVSCEPNWSQRRRRRRQRVPIYLSHLWRVLFEHCATANESIAIAFVVGVVVVVATTEACDAMNSRAANERAIEASDGHVPICWRPIDWRAPNGGGPVRNFRLP